MIVDALIRIDMSEYMEKFAVSRLIGAPPGYVGYEEGGQLTEKVRRKPYSVVLLDEIEKAHPDVFNILLQLFDDGALTDSFGRKVDFKNTVVIMTSNIGTRQIRDSKTVGFDGADVDGSYDGMTKKIMDELKKLFNPELLNRIDETVDLPLARPRAYQADHRYSGGGYRQAARRKGDQFQADAAKRRTSWCDKGFDPAYGARPLKRALQKYLEDPLAEEILRGQYAGDLDLVIGASLDRLTFTFNTAPKEQKVGQ